MEIRFSTAHGSDVERGARAHAIYDAAGQHGIAVRMSSIRDNVMRFTLLDADTDDHDRVIRALLQLDPDAVVRTAKAIYDGRDDFEAQVKARVP